MTTLTIHSTNVTRQACVHYHGPRMIVWRYRYRVGRLMSAENRTGGRG